MEKGCAYRSPTWESESVTILIAKPQAGSWAKVPTLGRLRLGSLSAEVLPGLRTQPHCLSETVTMTIRMLLSAGGLSGCCHTCHDLL